MKRYVRTKDGCITEGNFEIGKMIATLYGDERITKENTADTIEELCDEFVIEFEEKHHIVFDKNKLLKSVIDIQKMIFGGATILGAIWTYKGLIYVAKMNDKGELELL